jgi:N-methylhydantoinase A
MPRRKTTQPELRIAVDTGGTFTDCVWVERGRLRQLKVFSTPADPSQAIVAGLKQIGLRGPLVLLHGTTVGTNALLQRRGARLALVTTAGFEDAIEIGRQARPRLYDFFFDRVAPLAPAELRFGIEERTAGDGEILRAPAPEALDSLAEKVRQSRPEAVAICLLFGFANPKNESLVASTLGRLGVPLSISHQILPEFREYERMSTVTVNAYLQPMMQSYLENLERQAQAGNEKSRAKIFVMQSSGGIAALRAAAAQPVRTILSGPAGGVVGAAALARRAGFARIISFDMGGTSTDVALIDGQPTTGNQAEIAGLPVGVPMLDIHTVGAGGGSLARFDAGGALRVGPESAGADPGPICYGRGAQPTVTDANLLLGRLQPDRFLGGTFALDLKRTRALVAHWLKQQGSKLNLEQFAAGVIRVVNATMERAIRVVSVERGHDPRDFTLVAFGGAGGLHACELARALRIPRVIVPALPGALSAVGILASDVVKDYSRTVLWRVRDALPLHRLEEEFLVLSRQAEKDFRGEGWRGAVGFQRSVDIRYRGQGFELNIPYSRKLLAAFAHDHQRRYGYQYDDREVELVTLRLRAVVKPPKAGLSSDPAEITRSSKAPEYVRVFSSGTRLRAALYDRAQLRVGKKYRGPAFLTEYSATTFIPPAMTFRIDRPGNVVILPPMTRPSGEARMASWKGTGFSRAVPDGLPRGRAPGRNRQ